MKQFINLVRAGSAAIIFLAGNTLFAEESAVINPKTSNEWIDGGKALTAVEGEGALACKGSVGMQSQGAIKLDPEKSYRISGFFKLAPDSKAAKFYLGIAPLNDKGEQIWPENVNAVAGTETELVADCNPDDTVIKIKNGEKWRSDTSCMIAFNADDSGAKADLPNTEISRITKVEKKDGIFEVTLKNKSGKKYASGTKVREHESGATYIYFGATNKDVSADWTESAAVFKKADCWPGACGAKIVILANVGGKPDQTMMIKDVKLEELK